MKKEDVQINIVLSTDGVEKVQIYGDVRGRKEGLKLYDSIYKRIESLDRTIREKHTGGETYHE